MKKRNLMAMFFSLIALFCWVSCAYAGYYENHTFFYSNGVIKDLAQPGWIQTHAYDINNSGQVVGFVQSWGLVNQAFLWSEGVMTYFGSPNSYPFAINDRGQVVGKSGNQAFLYSNGVMQDLAQPGWIQSSAFDINNSGQVLVGADNYGNFLYSNGVMTNLNTLPGWTAGAGGFLINDSGQITGRLPNGGSYFLYSNGVIKDLAHPGWTVLSITGLNNNGDVVGFYADSIDPGAWKAFLYSKGVMTTLGGLTGAERTWANDINDSGQIVGASRDINAQYPILWSNGVMMDLGLPPGFYENQAVGINDSDQILVNSLRYVRDDVPLPPTVLLLGSGLLGLVGWRRLKKG